MTSRESLCLVSPQFVPRHEEEPELAPTKPIPKPKAKQKVQETVIETLNAPKTLVWLLRFLVNLSHIVDRTRTPRTPLLSRPKTVDMWKMTKTTTATTMKISFRTLRRLLPHSPKSHHETSNRPCTSSRRIKVLSSQEAWTRCSWLLSALS